MSTRKELKKQVKEQFLSDKLKKKERLKELSLMTSAERKENKKKDKANANAAKKERKAAIKAMPKGEKRKAKRQDKYYSKLRKRPRRLIIWGVILALLVFVSVYYVIPIAGNFIETISVDLTTDTQEAKDALAHGEAVSQMISDEGIVLLKNENNSLPLKEMKLNVFGFSAVNFRLGGGGSGGADQSRSVDLFQGLKNAGINYNEELYDYYMTANSESEQSTGMGQVIMSRLKMTEPGNERSIEYLTDEMIQSAKEYSENAMIVLANMSVEASDASLEDLALSENQAALIEKVANNFENVIIVLNTGNARELGFIDEYDSINAALWVGTPGAKGTNSLGRTLTGELNPSGRLVDTYAYHIEDHPSIVNFGDYDYINIKGMAFLNYEEGIYVGYRYFETYYQGDEQGYQNAVQYPFGYGLSYTDFEWEVVSNEFNMDTMTVDVKVTNTGDMAGKDVVQVYFSAPYYEGGIEKSAIELAGYAKTSLLEAGQSEVVTISFSTREMSSYDMNVEKAYVLDKGMYEIHVSKNVHEHVSSISFEVADTVVYAEDEATGTQITNQFDYASGDLTYLSRSDWEGTYPDISDMVFEASQEVLDAYNAFIAPEKTDGTVPITGADNSIMLKELKGLDYDDPMWDKYLDQFTLDEMNTLINNGAWKSVAIERLGLPATILMDGPAGINNFFKGNTAASYPTESVLASTWNDELAYMLGDAVGQECNAYGVDGWYAPAMNVHRSPLGGRNFEYFSEDPMLSGRMSAGMINGAQSHDVMVFSKHFALNEQEVNARSGLFVWANEQAIREIYLKPFEISVKEGDATGVMSSFIHIGYKWAGGSPELLQNVLRDEWGFVGLVSTDAALGGWMDLNLAVRYGNELMLSPTPTMNERYFKKLYKEDPVGFGQGIRERTHNICYSILNYTNLLD